MSLLERRERKHRIQQLRSIPLVARCTDRQLEAFDQLGAMLDVSSGSRLTEEGTPGRDCFLVFAGAAAAQKGDRRLGDVTRGTVGGELALLDGTARSATVVAATPMRLLVFTPVEFRDLLDVAPCIADGVLETAERRRAAL